jgi:hypothetical protein
MGAHFTNHSPQLGVLVLAWLIVRMSSMDFDMTALSPWSQIGASKYGRVWAKYGRVESRSAPPCDFKNRAPYRSLFFAASVCRQFD